MYDRGGSYVVGCGGELLLFSGISNIADEECRICLTFFDIHICYSFTFLGLTSAETVGTCSESQERDQQPELQAGDVQQSNGQRVTQEYNEIKERTRSSRRPSGTAKDTSKST